MPASKAQQKAVNKYIKSKYDRLNVTIKKGSKSLLESVAQGNINGYVKKAIKAQYKADTGKDIEL